MHIGQLTILDLGTTNRRSTTQGIEPLFTRFTFIKGSSLYTC